VRGQHGRDEVDVFFELDGTHFILEAKWLQAPVDVGELAKLQDRLASRPAGTHGVFLSISGYTSHVERKAEEPRWPQILLLDRSHFKAMIAGLLAPRSFLRAVLRHAARHGGSYVRLAELIRPRTTVPPAFAPPAQARPPGRSGNPQPVRFKPRHCSLEQERGTDLLA
jgi:hypothetical protein